MKRFATLFLALALLVSAIPFLPVEASAASNSWPELGPSCYAEYISPGSTSKVYQNAKMTVRGTASPKKSYNSSIDQGDGLRLYGFTSNGSVMLDYPVGSTRRVAYVPTKTLFGVSAPAEVLKAKASVTTYKIIGSKSSRYGSIAIGDTCYRGGNVNINGDSYILFLYEAISGNRGWKVGFIKKSDYEMLRGHNSNSQDASMKAMSYSLYKSSNGRLSCGFDGYVNTRGRHEGIDFIKGYGCNVYSLTDGIVTRVTQGYNGAKGLSTIAIYSGSTNKTVIYLHTDPVDSLYVGQYISKGQKIATEAWRGCSSSSSTHTHVEVRNGRRTAAAVSVGDYRLDNPNPTTFWKNQGYTVK